MERAESRLMWTIPNILTLLRIVLIPVFVGVFYLPVEWAGMGCAVIFALAAVTDWLDGHLARKWAQTSPLGAFLWRTVLYCHAQNGIAFSILTGRAGGLTGI